MRTQALAVLALAAVVTLAVLTPAHKVDKLRKTGFPLNLSTGMVFVISEPGQYVGNRAWWAKVFFLLVAGLNVMVFETRLSARVLALGPDDDTPILVKVVGAVSLISWFGVLYCGRMLPFIDPSVEGGL